MKKVIEPVNEAAEETGDAVRDTTKSIALRGEETTKRMHEPEDMTKSL